MALYRTLFINLTCDICFAGKTFAKRVNEDSYFSDDDQEEMEDLAKDRAELESWELRYLDEDFDEIKSVYCPFCSQKIAAELISVI
jgi:uridine kinase